MQIDLTYSIETNPNHDAHYIIWQHNNYGNRIVECLACHKVCMVIIYNIQMNVYYVLETKLFHKTSQKQLNNMHPGPVLECLQTYYYKYGCVQETW